QVCLLVKIKGVVKDRDHSLVEVVVGSRIIDAGVAAHAAHVVKSDVGAARLNASFARSRFDRGQVLFAGRGEIKIQDLEHVGEALVVRQFAHQGDQTR